MKITSFSEAKTEGANEDALKYAMHPLDKSLHVVMLADGQGGRTGGAEAARTAVTSALNLAIAGSVPQMHSERFWRQLLLDVDKAVFGDPDAGFTTFVGAAVSDKLIVGVSSGDSQALLIHRDQSSSMLTAKQKKNPPVGSGMCHPISFSMPFPADSQLVLMSDGVYKFVDSDFLRLTIRVFDPNDAIQKLRERAIGKSGTLYDDFSLILIDHPRTE